MESVKMKLWFFILLYLTFNLCGFAQAPYSQESQILVVEKSAEPVGGMSAFYTKYIKKNLKYPVEAKKNNIEGWVTLQFAVDIDGSLTDIQVMKGLGYGCDEEAIRLLREAPKWKPALLQGKPVKQRISAPIPFKIK